MNKNLGELLDDLDRELCTRGMGAHVMGQDMLKKLSGKPSEQKKATQEQRKQNADDVVRRLTGKGKLRVDNRMNAKSPEVRSRLLALAADLEEQGFHVEADEIRAVVG